MSKRPEWHTKLTVGQCYLFTEITSMIYVGRVVSIDGCRVVLEEASWVASTGRLHQFMRDGNADNVEVEPVGIRGLQWSGWSPWPHSLFTEAV